MNFNDNPYANMMTKINYLKIVTYGTAAVGGILVFISLFIPFPAFIYTASIGGAFLIAFLVCKIIEKKKEGPKVKTAKTKKVSKNAKVIERNDLNVIARCPSCQKKLRLPNKKGKHEVHCPNCGYDFKIKI